MAKGNETWPQNSNGVANSDNLFTTRGIRVCYVGTPTEGSGETGLLSELGAKVERYTTAEQGFNAVLDQDFDLLLVNLTANTGGMGGPEFIRLVRNCGHPGKSQLPIVAIASQRQLQHAARLQALGADELIGTPIDIAVLHAKIGNLLQNRGRSGTGRPAAGANAGSRVVANPPVPGARPVDPAAGLKRLGEGLSGEAPAKDVAPMKQKFDLSQMPPAGTPDAQQDGASKGFLERLSDRIMARLSKSATGTEPPTEGAPTLGTRPAAPPSAPRMTDAESEQISQVLRGLGRPTTAPTTERVTPPPQAAVPPPAKRTTPAPAAPAGKPAATRDAGDAQSRQPYVSPIRRPQAAPTASAAAPVIAAPAGNRITEAEKNRVQERVKKLVTTARRSTDATPSPATTPKQAASKSLRVCFLEDSCTSSHAIREMLGEEHHEVDHFSSAEEALDAVMEKDYDVLLASQIVALGGMDCMGLIQTIRGAADTAKRSMPIVAITANPDPTNLEPFFVAGASDVVIKPIEGKELNRRLLDTVKMRTFDEPVVGAPKAPAPGGTLKVCFLEDSCTSSHAIREMLGEKGHEVDHFSSAEEALDAILEKNYDVVLASQIVALGGMDCEQLVRTVRSGAKRDLPVTVITANPEPENIDKFQQAGANDVLLKPVEGGELNERLMTVVRAKAAPVPVAAPRALPKKLHVCFLEDSCTSSHAIREMLGDQGHEVDHFSTAEEALDAFQEIDYDVLLASQIPGAGGLDTEGLVRRVRTAAGGKKQRPIVLLTTDGTPENQQRFRRAGVNEVVIKPVEGNLGHRLLDVVGRGRAAPVAAPAERAPVAVPEHLRVCFLEDSCTSSHAIREMLGEAGHEVDHFSSAEEALDAFLEKPYDVLLASQIVALGGLDCEGLVKTIRGHGKSASRHAPIVVITANGEPANVESFMRVGADSVVIKPIEGNLGDQLKQVVGHVLNQPASPQLRVVPRARLDAPRAAAPAAAPAAAASKPAPVVPPPAVEPPKAARPAPMPQVAREAVPVQKPAAPALDLKKALGASAAPAAEVPRIKLSDLPPTGAVAKTAAPRAGMGVERKVIAAMFAVGIGAVIAMNWHHFGESTPVNVVAVERGPIYSSLNAPGMIVSKKKVELTTPVPGQITKVLAKEGDKVAKGDVLATLDDRDARIQLQRAEANLESARKDVALNERTMDRLVRALQMGAVSRQMAEDAEAAVNAARAKQRVAEEESRAAELLAERLNVTAPFDGVVTANFAVEGLWAEPPGPLFTVVDMNQREIELRIDAADVNRVTVGQRVTLSSDAAPGQWSEQVVRVAPAATRMGGMANVINVYTTLGPEAPPLHYGQQVDGQIRIAANENAIKIPFAALTTRNQRSVVGVIEDERLVFKPVVTGIESGTHVEIREGLKAGDQVILINKELEEGIHVEPVELHD